LAKKTKIKGINVTIGIGLIFLKSKTFSTFSFFYDSIDCCFFEATVVKSLNGIVDSPRGLYVSTLLSKVPLELGSKLGISISETFVRFHQ
jgi:hypothetical protein